MTNEELRQRVAERKAQLEAQTDKLDSAKQTVTELISKINSNAIVKTLLKSFVERLKELFGLDV